LKDSIEDYQSGRTDFSPVSYAQYSLLKAKTKLCIALNKYFSEAREFEANGQYNYGNNPNNPYHYPSVYPTSPLTHPYYPNSFVPSDPEEDLNAL